MTLTQIHFGDPWVLPLLAGALLALALNVWRERQPGGGVLYPSLGLIRAARPAWRARLRWVLLGTRFAALALLVLALARPQLGLASYSVPVEGIDIVLTLDTSSSMTSEFGGVVKMAATKRAAQDFLAGLERHRVAVVLFSGESVVLSPLTIDYGAARRAIEPVEAGQLLEDGTAIGTGLATALNVLRDSVARAKVVILLTDGENNMGQITPLDAAQVAKLLGVRVYTIGAVPSSTTVTVDERLLRRISDTTGGQYYRVTDETTLRRVYLEIAQLETARVGTREIVDYADLYLPLLALGALLLVLEAALGLTLLRRIP